MAAKPAPKSKPAPKGKPAAEAAAPAPKAKKETAPKAEKAPREKLEEQNGVTRPKAGTATGKVWELADQLSKQHKRPATRGEVFEANKALGKDAINDATVATQFQRWRVFNGVEKAAPAPKPAKAEKAAPKAKGKKAEAQASA
jgi:hypothetical protein